MSGILRIPDPSDQAPAVSPMDVRIGDRERDNACQQLTEHFAAGRLQQVEFEARVDLVMRAATRRELLRLLADLPRPVPAAPPAPAPAPARTSGSAVLEAFAWLGLIGGGLLAFIGFFLVIGLSPGYVYLATVVTAVSAVVAASAVHLAHVAARRRAG